MDQRNGEVKLQTDNLDDLWHLERILSPDDTVESKSIRTYKAGTKEEKKPVTIRIRIEQITFAESRNRLRLLGKIISGRPEEFIQIGRYHTIDVSDDSTLRIFKEWKHHQIKRLKEAESESKKPRIRIIVLDDQKALTASLRSHGLEFGHEIRFSGSKKDEKHDMKEREFFGDIVSEIKRHPERYLIAGPGFTKDNLKDFITNKYPDILDRLDFHTCSHAERTGAIELIKKGIVKKVMGQERLEEEERLIDDLLFHINKDDGLCAYGEDEVRLAAKAGAISKLLVLDDFLRNSNDAEDILKLSEEGGSDITIFSSEGSAGERLKGLGKIAAILRYRIR